MEGHGLCVKKKNMRQARKQKAGKFWGGIHYPSTSIKSTKKKQKKILAKKV